MSAAENPWDLLPVDQATKDLLGSIANKLAALRNRTAQPVSAEVQRLLDEFINQGQYLIRFNAENPLPPTVTGETLTALNALNDLLSARLAQSNTQTTPTPAAQAIAFINVLFLRFPNGTNGVNYDEGNLSTLASLEEIARQGQLPAQAQTTLSERYEAASGIIQEVRRTTFAEVNTRLPAAIQQGARYFWPSEVSALFDLAKGRYSNGSEWLQSGVNTYADATLLSTYPFRLLDITKPWTSTPQNQPLA